MIDDNEAQPAQDSQKAPRETVSTGPVDYRDIRGDALREMAEFIGDHLKPTVTGIVDPVSKTHALVTICGDGRVSSIPASTFNDYLIGPRTRGGSATLLSLDSFIKHANRFSDEDSVIFADNNRAKPSLTAVYDYHMADTKENGITTERGTPRFGRHRATFNFPLSDEWLAWNAKNEKPMPMKDFAHFLEDHAVDVLMLDEIQLSPPAERYVERIGGRGRIADPSALVTLAQNFEVYEQSNAGRSENLSSGEGKANLEVIHVDAQGRPLSIPTMFVIGIPVFKMGDVFSIIARLRYRKVGGEIVFFYELWRTDILFDTAFNEAVTQVEDETSVPVLLGAPEVAA